MSGVILFESRVLVHSENMVVIEEDGTRLYVFWLGEESHGASSRAA
jgi:hypothetical protein